MQIELVAVGQRMPPWVEDGYREYARRLTRECQLVLREIAPAVRSKSGDAAKWRQTEGERIIAAVTHVDHAVALDRSGRAWSTEQLATLIEQWMNSYRRVALLIGGPDGLSQECLDRAGQRWSLSPLTFPHPLVRVIVAEQLYRAWSLLQGHPYHRE
ncbi:MAG: 23S rRNA (pseudouridine(1915)-N(3))-methyltransferase RlmH [Methylotetracoccus sp.]